LDLKAEKSWGNYQVTISRGKAFPTRQDDVLKLKASRPELSEQAALAAVAEGQKAFVLLQDDKGGSLAVVPLDLKNLLSRDQISVILPGHYQAAVLSLSLTRSL